jgi:hypothetical protein
LLQHYVLNKVKKPGLSEDAPQQKYPYSKSAQPTRRTSLKSKLPKQRSKSPSPTQGPKISRTTATRHHRNAAALILSSLVDQQTKERDR